ncbi:hypothetical protein WR25_15343 isoform L [Diploscapter pachys]|uniref:UVR domain-containing protein n=1 Tax=Diploscapter pachys TaxID=2018661 RepID=A0A2A2KL91_9BILA|nr:hypothetical protein WR25_15343 isoform L [Diploscapter pachys]
MTQQSIDFVLFSINGQPAGDKELLHTKEWVSEKTSEFPIELEIVLRRRANIQKVEIVAHNKFIPTRIELLCSEYEHSKNKKGLGDVAFKRVKSSPGKYELKTVYLDEHCAKLIFKVFECHIDINENTQNLVGIKEVKIYGHYESGTDESRLFDNDPDRSNYKKTIEANKRQYTQELASLIAAVNRNKNKAVAEEDFALAKDAQLAIKTLQMTKKNMEGLEKDKEEAIVQEDFQHAKDITDEIKALRSNTLSGINKRLLENVPPDSRHGDIHRPRNLFGDEIDPDLKPVYPPPPPKLFKPVDISPTEIPVDPSTEYLLPPRGPPSSRYSNRSSGSRSLNRARPQTHDSVRIHRPASLTNRRHSDTSTLSPPSSTSMESMNDRPSSTDSNASVETLKVRNYKKNGPSRPPSNESRRSTSNSRSSNRSQRGSRATNKFMEKENMIVPAALQRRNLADHNEIPNVPESYDDADLDEDRLISMVGPQDRNNVRHGVGAFGLGTMIKLYSKRFESRKDGIAELKKKMQKMSTSQAQNNFDCIISIVSKLLKDQLYSVYSDALNLLRYICGDFIPQHRLERQIPHLAAETHESIVLRIANPVDDKRSSRETMATFQEITNSERFAKAYAAKIVQTPTKSSNSRSDKGKALIIEELGRTYGIPNSNIGLSEKPLAKLAGNFMKHPDPEVRNIGKDVMLKIYTAGDKDSVRRNLPNSDIIQAF